MVKNTIKNRQAPSFRINGLQNRFDNFGGGMSDIVERLRDMNPLTAVACSGEAADMIESLRQQLTESQAREKKRVELMDKQYWMDAQYIPQDSTALDEALAKARLEGKREALLASLEEWDKPYGMSDGRKFIERLRDMADELNSVNGL